MKDVVREQYEAYPYPLRSPEADEAFLQSLSPLENLHILSHAGFSGRLDLTEPLSVLVAGGGTGDAALLLAHQLRGVGNPGRVTYLDLSSPSRDIARARARSAGLDNIDFHLGSLLDVACDLPGPYHYINCSGVLHHLDRPEDGARALAAVLAPGGRLGAMVYGAVGRTGVYQAQRLLRSLCAGLDLPEQVALARRILSSDSPPWLLRNESLKYQPELDDAEVIDRFLHPQDRAYSVPQVLALMATAGLQVIDFTPPLIYEPALFVHDPAILERTAALPRFERYAIAELLSGAITCHSWFAMAAGEPPPEPPSMTPEAVPRLLLPVAARLAEQVAAGSLALSVGNLDLKATVQPSPLAAFVLQVIDGVGSLGAIHSALQQHSGREIPWAGFATALAEPFSLLSRAGLLVWTGGG